MPDDRTSQPPGVAENWGTEEKNARPSSVGQHDPLRDPGGDDSGPGINPEAGYKPGPGTHEGSSASAGNAEHVGPPKVIEVNGRDRPGLLHDVTQAISDQGVQIASAHVTTYGVRAVDVFYVKDLFGLKVENERKLDGLRGAVLAALGPEPARAA